MLHVTEETLQEVADRQPVLTYHLQELIRDNGPDARARVETLVTGFGVYLRRVEVIGGAA